MEKLQQNKTREFKGKENLSGSAIIKFPKPNYPAISSILS